MAQGRLTATSAMTDSPDWPSAARDLPAQARVSVGLHLNFTEDFAGGAGVQPVATLGHWMLSTLARRIDGAAVESAICRQLDRFEDALGRAPDYVDGHQHVHQFAGIRDRLVQVLAKRYGSRSPWLRSTRPAPGTASAKARFIAGLGDRALRRLASTHGMAVSRWLVGVYDFQADRRTLQRYLEGWMDQAPDGSVFMCHPGDGGDGLADAIGAARQLEREVLSSDWFGSALERHGIELVARFAPPAS